MKAIDLEARHGLAVRSWYHPAIVFALRAIIGILFFLPFFWLVSTSLKTDSQLFKVPVQWIPNPIQWSNYPAAIQYIDFWLYLRNTLIIAVPVTLGTSLSSAIVAYGFSRIQWPGRDIVFLIVISTMMLPFQVTMIPLFIIFKNLNWLDSFRPLIIPAFFGNPFYIFLMRQFFRTIPTELSEAARIDGCSELRIFTQIILPLAKPVIATTALLTFINAWNEFLMPLIYLNRNELFPLALGLQQFQRQFGAEWALLMAASVLMTLPIIVLFFLTQKTFIQGITLTGMKG